MVYRGRKEESTTESEPLVVFIEVPKGSRNKYEWDAATGRFFLDRMLFTSAQYPSDYGFIPDTLAEDGDPLDALVLLEEPTFPGCHIRVKPVGVFEMWDEKGTDHKILTVPIKDARWGWVNDIEDVPQHILREIAHFFSVYKDLEMKKTLVGGWYGRDKALRVIEAAFGRCRTS